MKAFNKINLSYWIVIILVGSLMMGGVSGCKSKKKIAEQNAKEERARMIAKAKADLLALLNDDGNLTLEQKEDELDRIKALNIDDEEVQDLIAQVEEKLARERAEMEAEREREKEKEEAASVYNRVEDFFNNIAGTTSYSAANQLINEAMELFASPEVPVLIIINREGSNVDYDRPTTIGKYLNYLKDQDRNINAVENLEINSAGEITEVVLIRRYEQ